MNFTNNILSIFDPTHGLLAQQIKPGSAAGAASKATLKSAGMVPGLGALSKYFQPKSSPNTAGLKNAKRTQIQLNGGSYDNTAQAAKNAQRVQVSKSGIAQASINVSNRSEAAKVGSCLTPKNMLSDMRKLVAPNALDESLAGML